MSPAMISATGTRPLLARALRAALALALVVGLSAPIAACGKRGDPEHPAREGPKYPRTYPDPATYPPN